MGRRRDPETPRRRPPIGSSWSELTLPHTSINGLSLPHQAPMFTQCTSNTVRMPGRDDYGSDCQIRPSPPGPGTT